MNDNIGLLPLNLVYNIYINEEKYEKEEISVTITNLLTSTTEESSSITFETNVNSIKNMRSGRFEFRNTTYCYFKKYSNINLLFICIPFVDGSFTLNTMPASKYSNIHYKYIFKVQSVNNNETVITKKNGIIINYVFPEILNFYDSKTNTIRYLYANYSDQIATNFNIALNSSIKPSILECKDLLNMKKCNVFSSQFDYKENYYYFSYISNLKGKYVINYEINPIQTIFIDTIEIKLEAFLNTNQVIIGQKGTIYLITSYKDIKNQFNTSDIEDKTYFDTTIREQNNKEHNVKCRVWKPKDYNLRLFCDLDDPLSKSNTNIYFNTDVGKIRYNNF